MLIYLFLVAIFNHKNLFHTKVEKNNILTLLTSFKQHSIVPDVIDYAPLKMLELHYHNSHAVVEPATQFSTKYLRRPPRVTWPISSKDDFYTLIMVDPDVPSRTNRKYGQLKHWLVINIRGNDVLHGETLARYHKPNPFKGSGLHRYVFLVFQQPAKLNIDRLAISSSRINFKVAYFARDFNLGMPYAGNFYLAEYESKLIN